MDGAEPQIPADWRIAAEEVRAHLCLLRGGGAFLSPTDAWQLVCWLEEGIPVQELLRALERAADARRRTRVRGPLSLAAARRHLGRPTRGWFHRDLQHMSRGHEPALAPVVRAMNSVPTEPDPSPRADLAADLLAVDRLEPDKRMRAALAAVRRFIERTWDSLGDAGRARLRTEAEVELGDLLELVDGTHRPALIEETARDRLRQRYPALTAATFLELLPEGSAQ